jgi:hypothetical protein
MSVVDPDTVGPASFQPNVKLTDIPFSRKFQHRYSLNIENFYTFDADGKDNVSLPCCEKFFSPTWGTVRFRICLRIRIFLSSSKNSKKNPNSYCFVTSLWLLKNDVNVPSKSNKQKNLEKNIVLLVSWRSRSKISASILVRGADPRIRIRTKMLGIQLVLGVGGSEQV